MKNISLLSIALLSLSSCSVLQKGHNIQLEEVLLESPQVTERAYYHESPERINDLLHTKLNVSFDWDKKHLLGEATLDFKPYFHAQNSVTIDAKGFDIHQIALVGEKGTKTDLTYTYNDLQITVQLDRLYNRNETYSLYINYTAKPDDLVIEGGAAITDAKGLYFINPDGSENKPMQIWTQGETESSSCWFPCIDKPNERCTQELAITVQDKYTTLSNGILTSSISNNNGTRTDLWIQKKEHAPYLFMMAVGEFSVTEDKWRSLDVNYYVEPEEEKHAQRIFGKTPEMMEFYSNLLGFDYPWEKYSQVIVRDYVSGAMENTTAVIHGEFVYSDEREFIDDPNEMIIAHELFHHWFGDWVTCESWPNLPLNEGFATYGEYLWMEGKYSADEAAHYIHSDLKQYLSESTRKQVDHIRFDNENPNHMFDSHSYAKGGRILHMLRYAIGDDAFFSGLEYYLTEYANQAVEVHQLRLAMEHISGQDLNWFFNQWFLASGHPLISVEQKIEDNKVSIIVSQNQSLETTPLYRIPVEIGIYTNGKETRYKIELNKQSETFTFETASKAELVVFDTDHYLLGEISFDKSDEQWAYQLQNAAHYFDRMEAVDSLANSSNFAMQSEAVKQALQDPFWAIKTQGLSYFEKVDPRTQGTLEATLIKLASTDEKSDVRAEAIYCLSNFYDKNENAPSREHHELYAELVKDPSYIVAGEALRALQYVKPTEAYKLAKNELTDVSSDLKDAALYTIAKNGSLTDSNLIHTEFEKSTDFDAVEMIENFVYYLEKNDPVLYNKSLLKLEAKVASLTTWYIRYYALEILKEYTGENPDFKTAINQVYQRLLATEQDKNVLLYLEKK